MFNIQCPGDTPTLPSPTWGGHRWFAVPCERIERWVEAGCDASRQIFLDRIYRIDRMEDGVHLPGVLHLMRLSFSPLLEV
jgi:hypothetical protein